MAARPAFTHVVDQQDLGGWGWSVGGYGRVNERVDVGVSFEGPFTLDGTRTTTHKGPTGASPDTTTASEQKIDYPGTLRFGVTYHPRNIIRTTFSVEMERRFWETAQEHGAGVFGDSLDVRDTWELRVGLEHLLYNGLPVRFGFRYLENYADPESERSIFSAGVGYKFAGYAIDVTGLYHRQTSRQGFLFNPTYGTFQAPDTLEKVEDSVVQLVVGVSRTF
jgi:long-subunit fatty acid transport protein